MSKHTTLTRVTKEAHQHVAKILPVINSQREESGKKPFSHTDFVSRLILSMDSIKGAKL